MHSPVPNRAGRVYLVGAGPGDPGLVTVRAVECLRSADVVLYDYLANAQLLEHAPGAAERICLGRHGDGRIMPPDEVNRRMVEAAREGKSVVRLKGGDPMIFAHAAEEIECLHRAGIPFEIVPGITAAAAAAGYAGIPVTHRGIASAVALVTGMGQTGGPQPPIDYRRLAGFPGTLVFYMGVTSAPEWAAALVAGGMSPQTPAAIVRRCSWPDQVVIRCALAEVNREIERRKLRPPVITIVGEVAALDVGISWFTERPLFGQTVMVTRAAAQSAALRDRLAEVGAAVVEQPAITIGPPADWAPVDRALDEMDQYDWLVFSSANGVEHLVARVTATGRDLRCLAGPRLAAIGPGTAAELARYRLRADRQPDEHRAEALAEALESDARDKRFLLVRASRGREVLAEQLAAAGGRVDQVVVYESKDVTLPDAAAAAALRAGTVDWITVTSSAIARSLAAMFGDELRRARLASISPVTSTTLVELGFEPAAEATDYTMDGLVAAMVGAR